MGELGDWAKKNSKNFILDDGETREGLYQGYKIGPNPFDSDKELAFYRLTILQDGEQVVKIFKTAAGNVARFFDGCRVGQRVRITRHGEGSKTVYDLANLDEQEDGDVH